MVYGVGSYLYGLHYILQIVIAAVSVFAAIFSRVMMGKTVHHLLCVGRGRYSGSGQFSFPLCLLICFFLQKKTENELYVVNARAHVDMCDCYYTDDNHLLLSRLQIYLFVVITLMHLN